MSISEGPIVYFDGVCNLCNSVVKFIIRHDRDKVFRFASLQSSVFAKAMADERRAEKQSGRAEGISENGEELSPARDTHPGLRPPLPEKGRGVESGSELPTPAKGTPPCQEGSLRGALNRVILFYKGRYYTKSDAALKVARILGGVGWLLMPGYVLPRFIRNGIYDAVAKRRYKWFGRSDECMIPTPELKARFLDE